MILPYALENPSSNFTGTLATASGRIQDDPSPESYLRLALANLLCGRLNEAEAALTEAANGQTNSGYLAVLIDFARECIRYDRFERSPGEVASPDSDTDLVKTKTGYFWAMKNLADDNLGNCEDIAELLRQHRKARDWRIMRNTFGNYETTNAAAQAQIDFLLQPEIAFCRQEAQKGLLIPVLAVAGFYSQLYKAADLKNWIDFALSVAARSHDPCDLANCLLLEGDQLAAPYSNPLCWNFSLGSSYGNPGSDLLDIVEKNEFRPATDKDLDSAVEKYTTAEAIYEKAGSQRGMGHIALRMGYLAFLKGNYQDTERFACNAREHFHSAGDLCHTMLADIHLAMALALTHQTGRAQDIARKTANTGRKNGQVSWTAGLGKIVARCARHFNIRRYDAEKANNLFQLARQLQKAAGNTFAAAQHLIDMAKVAESAGQFIQATNLYLDGIAEMETFISEAWPLVADKSPLLMTSLQITNLCYANIKLGIQKTNPVEIDRWLKRAQDTTASMRQRTDTIDEQYRQFISFQLDSFNDLEGIAQVSSAIYSAKKARENGDKKKHDHDIELAKNTLDSLNLTPDTACMLRIKILVAHEDWQGAQTYARKYGELITGKPLPTLQGMDWSNAAGRYLADLTNYRSLNQVFSLLVRTRLFREARIILEKIEEVYGREWWINESKPWFEVSDIAEMWEGLGETARALEWYDKSLDLYEAYRNSAARNELRVAMADMQIMVYTIGYATRAAFNAGDPERAFRYSEAGKSRALLDLMEETRFFGQVAPQIKPILFKLRELDARCTSCQYEISIKSSVDANSSQIQALKEQLANFEQQRMLLEAEIREIEPAIFERTTSVSALSSIKQVADKLDEDTLLVAYYFFGECLFLWAVSCSGLLLSTKQEIRDWELKSSILALRTAIICKQPNWEQLAVPLSKNLLEPIGDLLDQYPRVVFVPHGALQGLPFHVLSVDGDYPIGITHSISYLPATGALFFTGRGQIPAESRILAVGNPSGNLKAAAAEARFLEKLYPKFADVFIEEEAKELAIMKHLPEARVLHFATHGNITEDNPMASSLELSSGEKLSVHEIMGVELNADLVVLSACNSGRGNQTAGDDLLGLSRALVAGGTKAAVLTYWSVDDLATCLWMQQFYRNLKNGDCAATAAKAAQVFLFKLEADSMESVLDEIWESIDSQNKYRNKIESLLTVARDIGFTDVNSPLDYKHPYYWGAFSVMSR